jgi:hypothetical protein
MSEAKHTPGPWKAELTGRGTEILGDLTASGGETVVCVIEGVGEQTDADACLIAAVPEMAELLRETRFGRATIEWDKKRDEILRKAGLIP